MAKRKRYGEEELLGAAPEPPSFLSKVGGAGLSGLSAVANLLDVPGSMVRDVAAGQNPLDQLASPFSDRNRTSGRDLNRRLGLAGSQDTYKNFFGGLGTEIATDPLTYLTLGGAAVGKGFGTVAAKSGVKGLEAARIATAASKAGKLASVGKWVGPREARLTLTGQHIKDFAPDVFKTLESTARANNFNLAGHMQEPLGALGKFWPLGDAGLMGTGKTAKKIARGLDVAGDFVRHARIPGTTIRPVGDLANLVNKKAGGATSAEEIQTAYHRFNEAEKSRYVTQGLVGKWANDLVRAGHRQTDALTVRDWFEFPHKAPPEVQPLVQEVRAFLDDIPNKAKELGMNIEDLLPKTTAAGSNAQYFMRHLAEGLTGGGAGGKLFAPSIKANRRRMAWTLSSRGGTKAISDMVKDQKLEAYLGAGDVQGAAKYIETAYGSNFSPTFKAGKSGKNYNTYKAAARALQKMSPEARKAGIYSNHPLQDFLSSAVGTMERLKSSEIALSHIAEHVVPAGTDGAVPITQVLRGIALKQGDGTTGGAAKWLADRGINAGDAVPAETAKFLTQNFQRVQGGPEQVHAMLKLYDNITGIIKATFTNLDPVRFNVRNRASGAAASALADLDQLAAGAATDADRLVKGQPIVGAAKNAFIQEEATKRGITNLDDARATEILREMAFARELSGSYGVSNLPHHVNVSTGSTLEDLMQAQPGGHPFSWKGAVGKLVGQGTTWNPLKGSWRGIGGAEKSTFAPLAFGEDVSYWTESMNRIAPFWALLQNGVHPDEAIQRVLSSQVGYQGRFYTATEQQVLKRLFLFYSFSKGMVPFTLQQLLENPGGRLAQTLRTMNVAKGGEDELTPQHIQETAAVPVPELPFMQPLETGAKRYITGFGMGFEDPAQFAVPSFQNLGLEALSRANPLIKGPLEAITGQSFFQRAPGGGGRSLEDLDPALGRTLANIGELTGMRSSKAPVRYPMSNTIEHLLSNSPVSNLLTKARTATDPRKGNIAKTINLFSGVKATDVSPAAQDRELRNRISLVEKKLGAKTFMDTYLPSDVKANLSPEEAQAFAQLQALRRLLEERSKARKK